MSDLKITHGIYKKKDFLDKEGIVTRRTYFRNVEGLQYFNIPEALSNTLKKKMKSWKNKVEYIEFTYGCNEEYAVITIVSPKDHFNHKIGYTITKGRLEQAEKILERDFGLIDGFVQVVEVAEK